MSFAFTTNDVILAPVGENGEKDSYLPLTNNGTDDGLVTEDEVLSAKMKTAIFAQTAEQEIAQFSNLLAKLKTGTATRNERDHLLSMNAKHGKLKCEIEYSKQRETEIEMKLLRSRKEQKVLSRKRRYVA